MVCIDTGSAKNDWKLKVQRPKGQRVNDLQSAVDYKALHFGPAGAYFCEQSALPLLSLDNTDKNQDQKDKNQANQCIGKRVQTHRMLRLLFTIMSICPFV